MSESYNEKVLKELNENQIESYEEREIIEIDTERKETLKKDEKNASTSSISSTSSSCYETALSLNQNKAEPNLNNITTYDIQDGKLFFDKHFYCAQLKVKTDRVM